MCRQLSSFRADYLSVYPTALNGESVEFAWYVRRSAGYMIVIFVKMGDHDDCSSRISM